MNLRQFLYALIEMGQYSKAEIITKCLKEYPEAKQSYPVTLLYRATQSGKNAAFKETARVNANGIYSFPPKHEMPNFKNYQALLRKIAHQFNKTTGVDYEELEAESYLLFCKSLTMWDPERGAFASFLQMYVRGQLINYTKDQRKKIITTSLDSIMGDSDSDDSASKLESRYLIDENMATPERFVLFKEAMRALSSEAQQIIEIVLQSEAELLFLAKSTSTRKLKAALKRMLSGKRTIEGLCWTGTLVSDAFDEISQTIQDF